MKISIKNFDGPLDLLLTLIKEHKLNIEEIDIAELANKYLEIISSMQDKDIDIAADYLVMASHLLYLKTKILLDNPKDKEEIESEKDDLLKQLIIYQQFKVISKTLKEKEHERTSYFMKPITDYDEFKIPEDETKLHGKSEAIQLLISLRKMFERVQAQSFRKSTIESFNLSPAERRKELLEVIKGVDKPTFEQIFSVPTMNHFVVTMLTILDMSRKGELIIIQDKQFGDITFEKGVIND